MVAQVVETIDPRIPGGGWPTRDMPADLTPEERRAYSRGYSRGISAHTKKHGATAVALTGPAPAPGTPERVALGMKLRTMAIEREAERHDTCHRAGMAAVKRYRRIRMPDLAHLAYLPKKLPPAPKLTPAPKLEPAAAPVDETPAELEPAADVVGAAIGSGRLQIVRVGTPELEDETPEAEELEPADAPEAEREDQTPADETPEDVDAPARVHRTRKLARRELAAAMRARGEDPADPDAWAAAKRAAGVK